MSKPNELNAHQRAFLVREGLGWMLKPPTDARVEELEAELSELRAEIAGIKDEIGDPDADAARLLELQDRIRRGF